MILKKPSYKVKDYILKAISYISYLLKKQNKLRLYKKIISQIFK